jgi:hypothetical protein
MSNQSINFINCPGEQPVMASINIPYGTFVGNPGIILKNNANKRNNQKQKSQK